MRFQLLWLQCIGGSPGQPDPESAVFTDGRTPSGSPRAPPSSDLPPRHPGSGSDPGIHGFTAGCHGEQLCGYHQPADVVVCSGIQEGVGIITRRINIT